MIFADLAAGDRVFLDANPLVYHFTADPVLGTASTELVRRIENKELAGFTSTHTLSEIAHKLMILEAATLFGWPSKVVQHLRKQPQEIQKLKSFRPAIEKVPHLGIQVTIIPPGLVVDAAQLSQQYGLLSNDALIVAAMQLLGLTSIASNDADFDRVPWLTRFAPV